MGKLKDMVTGPYEVMGEPGKAQVVVDMRTPEGANPAVAASHDIERAQLVRDALNFYHNFAQAAADDHDFTQVPERGLTPLPRSFAKRYTR